VKKKKKFYHCLLDVSIIRVNFSLLLCALAKQKRLHMMIVFNSWKLFSAHLPCFFLFVFFLTATGSFSGRLNIINVKTLDCDAWGERLSSWNKWWWLRVAFVDYTAGDVFQFENETVYFICKVTALNIRSQQLQT